MGKKGGAPFFTSLLKTLKVGSTTELRQAYHLGCQNSLNPLDYFYKVDGYATKASDRMEQII